MRSEETGITFGLMLLSDQIESLAPAGASHYRLTLRIANGVERSYPAEPGSFFRVGRAPGIAPDGHYTINFFDDGLRRIGGSDRELVIDMMSAAQSPSPERAPASSDISSGVATPIGRQGINSHAHGVSWVPSSSAASRRAFRERYLAEQDPERRRQLLDAAVEEPQMAFVRNSKYAREVGEVFLLNRMRRRELLQMHSTIVENSASAYGDLGPMKATVLGLSEIQKEVLDHMKAQFASVDQSPPAPDYVGLGMAALATVQEIGLALASRPSHPVADRAAHHPLSFDPEGFATQLAKNPPTPTAATSSAASAPNALRKDPRDPSSFRC